MSDYKVIQVDSDAKTKKGTKENVLTGICYLSPSKEADGVHDLCTFATDECRKACLYGAGMAGVFPSIKANRIKKTLWYLNNPETFTDALRADIRKLIRVSASRGMTPAVRFNGTSDIPKVAMQMAREFPTVQFYDYTKIPRAWQRTLPNYHLTFSFSGSNLAECMDAMSHGINVAVVFPTADFPATWNGFPVVNGDANDLRFKDPVGVIVGLKAKGDAMKLAVGGFVQIGA